MCRWCAPPSVIAAADDDVVLSGGHTAGGYQLVTPAYYDQSGQLVMGGGRAMPQMVRLMSPATLLTMNSAAAAPQHGECFHSFVSVVALTLMLGFLLTVKIVCQCCWVLASKLSL